MHPFKPYAIFDMDGTLLDSMSYWHELGRSCLRSCHIPIPDDLEERVKAMTLSQSAVYFVEQLGLPGQPEAIADQMRNTIRHAYEVEIQPKPGAVEYLQYLRAQGVRTCIATATDLSLAQPCLQRLNLLPLLDFVVSCEETGAGKSEPDVFLLAVQRFSQCVNPRQAPAAIVPSQVTVYEDACHAARTAREAGFYTVGVYDALTEQALLKPFCHHYITDFPSELARLRGVGR